jgi:polysaccharide biosynthesis/export protein
MKLLNTDFLFFVPRLCLRASKKHRGSLFILFYLFALSSCVRYVVPRSELGKEDAPPMKAGDPANANVTVGNSEDFHNYEVRLKEKLQQLVQSRKSISGNSIERSYRIGPGDVMTFSVFELPELSSELEVAADGSVAVPVIGDNIPAGGKTLAQFRSELISRLRPYVRVPRVNLSIKQYQANRVYVVGEVTKPGTYPLKRVGQQLIELVSEAGGRTDKASGRIILVPAQDNLTDMPQAGSVTDVSTGVEISMDDLVGGVDSRPVQIPLMAGDTIIIPEGGTVEVYGEVEKPGSYKASSKTSALGAVASAGGFTYAAKVDEVEVIRDMGDGKKIAVLLNLEDVALKGMQDVRVRDGDIVRVPSARGLFMKRQIVDAINGTFRGVGINRQYN